MLESKCFAYFRTLELFFARHTTLSWNILNFKLQVETPAMARNFSYRNNECSIYCQNYVQSNNQQSEKTSNQPLILWRAVKSLRKSHRMTNENRMLKCQHCYEQLNRLLLVLFRAELAIRFAIAIL